MTITALKTFACAVLFLVTLVGHSQDLVSKGHFLYGTLSPASKDYDKVYGEGTTVGGNFMVGKNNLLLLLKYQNFTADGTPKFQNLPEDPYAKWKQDFYTIGLRYYENQDQPLGFFTEIAFVHSKFKDSYFIDEPGYEDFNMEYKDDKSGFSVGLGAVLRIGFISIEGAAEYIRVMAPPADGLIQDDVNIGGVMFTIGAGLSIKEKDEK